MHVKAEIFPCPGCGSAMRYAPGTDNLHCDYCGSDKPIDVPPLPPEMKRELGACLSRVQSCHPGAIEKVLDCPGCGADVSLEPLTIGEPCPYCGTPLLSEPGNPLPPSAVLPFAVTHKKAQGIFKRWIGNLWFAPNALKRVVDTGKSLEGYYLPFWIFDADTRSYYEGERGDAYYVTVQRMRVMNGREVPVQEQERRIRWTPVSGSTSRTFRDLPIVATDRLPPKLLARLQPWASGQMQCFDLRWLSGFTSHEYSRPLESGYEEARGIMQSVIRNDVLRSIGGDEQRIYGIDTRYDGERFAVPLFPIWSSTFRYGGRNYTIAVNAVSGEIAGERPYSYWKIFFLILTLTAIAGAAAWFYRHYGGD
ncbi:hypothetical protein [Nitratifractor sp.]|uniref:hypothetical protein n=1 Tax=Nitratifractor sp. TaxID=2268144 RepID=UPI0025D96B85|nr:hypothetical protein [Nitratifractor sp.]